MKAQGYQRILFCPLRFSMESQNLFGGKWPHLSHFPTERLCDSIENHMEEKGSLGIDLHQKDQNQSRNGWVMVIFPLGGYVIPLKTTWDKRRCLGVHLYQKYTKLVKKWLSYGYFPLRGCVIPLRTTEDKRSSFSIHFYQKDPTSVKKWLSYGYFAT